MSDNKLTDFKVTDYLDSPEVIQAYLDEIEADNTKVNQLLLAENEELRNWKAEQLIVMDKLDIQAIGKLVGVKLGSDISPLVEPYIKAQAETINELMAHVAEIEALGIWSRINEIGDDEEEEYEIRVEATKAFQVIASSPAESLAAVRNEERDNCMNAVMSELLNDPSDSPDDIAYDNAVRDCTEAIWKLRDE